MPEKETIERARQDEREGKSPTTQAGEFVREEIHHIREGKHGARSAKQAIAIGLSKARRAGVKLPRPPASAKASTKKSASYATRAASHGRARPSPRRSRTSTRAPKRESRSVASRKALAPNSPSESCAVCGDARAQSTADTTRTASSGMSNRNSAVMTSVSSSRSVNRSRSSVPNPDRCNALATARLRELWRLLPLPCA